MADRQWGICRTDTGGEENGEDEERRENKKQERKGDKEVEEEIALDLTKPASRLPEIPSMDFMPHSGTDASAGAVR